MTTTTQTKTDMGGPVGTCKVSKRPAITAPVRRGAIVLLAVMDNDQLVVVPGDDGDGGQTGRVSIRRQLSTEQKSDLRRYIRFQNEMNRYIAAMGEAEAELTESELAEVEDGEEEADDLEEILTPAGAPIGGAA